MKEAIEEIYSLRKAFLVVGLTGAGKSACITASNIFTSDFNSLNSRAFKNQTNSITNASRTDSIIFSFSEKNWQRFNLIRFEDIITYFILRLEFNEFINYLRTLVTELQIDEPLKILKESFENLQREIIDLNDISKQKDDAFLSLSLKLYFQDIPLLTDKLKQIINPLGPADSGLFAHIYTLCEENIRKTGTPVGNTIEVITSDFLSLAHEVKRQVNLLKLKGRKDSIPTFVAINGLANPYDLIFLRENLSSFFLVSIHPEEESISDDDHPLNIFNLPKESILDKYAQKCIELADIHLKEDEFLIQRILRYFSLMIKPGIVPPTPEERVMQIAYSAKLSSGCISRQVGAAITTKDFYVKALGWNSTPSGQVPCRIRNVKNLINKRDLGAYSEYEKSDGKFKTYFDQVYAPEKIEEFEKDGSNLSYCFKDIQNHIEGEIDQVHTRSLHAEENAFLQLINNGWKAEDDGKLFTTSSPCELCAKKAYHLGIKEVYFINEYPGISRRHIIGSGDNRPKLIKYTGAIGKAFHNLYNLLFSLREEIKIISNISFQPVRRELFLQESITNEVLLKEMMLKDLEIERQKQEIERLKSLLGH